MDEPGRTTGATPPGTPVRGRGAVAASILAALLIGGYFAASPALTGGVPAEFLVNAVVLALVFWFPAVRVTGPKDVLAAWRSLVPWILAWTLVWDLASSGVVGERDLFQEWWLVYPAGIAVVMLLLLLHGAVVDRVNAREAEDRPGDAGAGSPPDR